MIETRILSPGVTLRCCRDSRFKQGCLSIQFVRKMDRLESACNALLPNVLLRGSRRTPDLREITARLDLLYGASVSASVRRIGDYQTVGLYCGFMDDRFALPGDRVLEPMAAFLGELLLEPLAENGRFLDSYVESEKKNLISTMEAQRNDKRAWTMGQLLRQLCAGDSFGLPRLGEPEQVEAITPESLYRHYETVLRESPVELFYVGSAAAGDVARLLEPLARELAREAKPLPPQTALHPGPGGDFTGVMDVTQGQLAMGFVTPITNGKPEFAAMQVFNAVFGGSMTNKLFMNVREKQSLCYSIGSGYYGAKGIVTVSAGIDFDKEQAVRREVLRQLEACQAGDITESEFRSARESLLSGLRAIPDSPGAVEGYYATAALSGGRRTHTKYMAEIQAVTREQAAAAARTVRLHTTWFLKGGACE